MRATENGETRGELLRFLHRRRRFVGISYRKLLLVGALSVLAGFGQAALLLLIVRGATALTADTEIISGTVGPFSAGGLTTGDLIALGFVILGVLLVVEIAISYVQASLIVNASRSTQRRMLAAFTNADYTTQATQSRGEARQLVLGHPSYAGAAAGQLGGGMSSAVNFVVLVGSAIVLSPITAVVVLGGLLAIVVMLRPFLHATQRLSAQRSLRQRSMGGVAAERFELARELKALGADRYADEPILARIDEIASLDRRLRFISRMSSVAYRLGALALVLIMLTLIDAANASNLAALTGALLILLRSLSYGQAAQSAYQSLGESVPVLRQVLNENHRLVGGAEDRSGEVAPDDFHIGEICLDSVDFAYPDGEIVLSDCTLSINKGEFVALVGPSGSGKSTLMQLLLRLRDPRAGVLRVDGTIASDIPLGWWRDRVAYVAQEPKLRSGTVAEAIRFGRSRISESDVTSAAERAHIASEIEGWPDGYQTQIGQLGESVSGGQRQRLALARALAGRPDVLLLDEPTSALDPESEELVAQTLEDLRGEMAVVVVAHRMRTVENADRVIRVEAGRAVPQLRRDDPLLPRMLGEAEVADRAG